MSDELEKDDETEEPEGAKARLFGMVVNEVSFVDRAANKRTFLVTKRAPEMTTKKNAAPVAKNTPPAAAAAPVAKDGPQQGGAEDAAAAAGAKPGGGPDGAPAPAQAGGEGAGKLPPMQPQVKDALTSALASLAEKAVDIADLVKGAETDDKADGQVPEGVASALKELSQMVSNVVGQYAGGGGEAGKAGDLSGVTENGGVGAQGAQKADDELEKMCVAILEKAGKKMAKERLARFATALNSLAQIHRELKVSKSAGGRRPGAEAFRAELAAIADTLDTVTSSHEELQKSVASLRAENAELRKRAGVRNSEAGDGTGPGAPVAKSAVHWPLDMNNPRTAKGPATAFTAPTGR